VCARKAWVGGEGVKFDGMNRAYVQKESEGAKLRVEWTCRSGKGLCVYVCALLYVDVVSEVLVACKRVRFWDACSQNV
jgi:hypothetical protein